MGWSKPRPFLGGLMASSPTKQRKKTPGKGASVVVAPKKSHAKASKSYSLLDLAVKANRTKGGRINSPFKRSSLAAEVKLPYRPDSFTVRELEEALDKVRMTLG
jgi:hypothetical protein